MLIKLEPCLHNEQQPAGRKPLHNAELTITPLRITCCEISHDPAKKKKKKSGDNFEPLKNPEYLVRYVRRYQAAGSQLTQNRETV